MIKKYALMIAGSFFLAVGVSGVFIPVLPTTPFLLVAAYCYLRSSRRMYEWLVNHKILGAYIYCYLNYRAIPRQTKILTVVLLWTTLVLSMLLVPSLHLRILLPAVGAGVTIHILRMRTLRDDELKACADSCRNGSIRKTSPEDA